MHIVCNDGTFVTQSGNMIMVSGGEVYHLTGSMLTGSYGFVSHNVRSMAEAVAIVVGLHGGRRF